MNQTEEYKLNIVASHSCTVEHMAAGSIKCLEFLNGVNLILHPKRKASND